MNQLDTTSRALQSAGMSDTAIHLRVIEILESRGIQAPVVLDVGCGKADFLASLQSRAVFAAGRCIGLDAIKHSGFNLGIEFIQADLDQGELPVEASSSDLTVAIEVIEHLENPRAFMRELVRVTRPGGWLAVTTPNQLSLLSKLTLLFKNQFNAFQGTNYPAHLTALLEIDLRRIASECGLSHCEILHSEKGRILFTANHYPRALSRRLPRACSDNVILVAQKPLRPLT